MQKLQATKSFPVPVFTALRLWSVSVRGRISWKVTVESTPRLRTSTSPVKHRLTYFRCCRLAAWGAVAFEKWACGWDWVDEAKPVAWPVYSVAQLGPQDFAEANSKPATLNLHQSSNLDLTAGNLKTTQGRSRLGFVLSEFQGRSPRDRRTALQSFGPHEH